jgi:CRP-like cAMP-binding protein
MEPCVLYRVNEDGTEHTVVFALDGWFITDLYSFLTNEPSVYNIDAIEDSELVLITRSASDELRKTFSKIPGIHISGNFRGLHPTREAHNINHQP